MFCKRVIFQNLWRMGPFFISLVFLILFLQKINFEQFQKGILQINLVYLISALFLTSTILFFKTIQWHFFLKEREAVSLKKIFKVVTLYLMVANTVPFWGGELFAVYLLSWQKNIDKTIALSIITLDQISEAVSLIAIFIVVSLLPILTPSLQIGMRGVIVLVILLYPLLLFISHRYGTLKQVEFKPLFLKDKFKNFFLRWAHHLYILRSFKKTIVAFGLSILVKGLEVSALFLLQKGFDLSLPFWAPFIVIGALNLVLAIPIVPGNFGIFEGCVYYIYQFYFHVDPTSAILLGIFYHLIFAFPSVLIGSIFSIKMGIEFKKIFVRPNALVLSD